MAAKRHQAFAPETPKALSIFLAPPKSGTIDHERRFDNLRAPRAITIGLAAPASAARGDQIHRPAAPFVPARWRRCESRLHPRRIRARRFGAAFPPAVCRACGRAKPGRKLVRHRAAQNEARASMPATLSILRLRRRLHQFVHRPAERPCIAQQRGDVPKLDSGLGVVGNGADSVSQGHESTPLSRSWARRTRDAPRNHLQTLPYVWACNSRTPLWEPDE